MNWNGMKFGPLVNYCLDPEGLAKSRSIENGTYFGHNIAAIAFYHEGDNLSPIAFSFNHVDLFQSPSHHAEHRLIDWIFANPQVFLPQTVQQYDYSTLGQNITLVSSLEPCWQCAGKIKMAGIREVVYLQDDFALGSCMDVVAQGLISGNPFLKVYPGTMLDLPELNISYKEVMNAEFCTIPIFYNNNNNNNNNRDEVKFVKSVPTFLCTSASFSIFEDYSNRYINLTRDRTDPFVAKLYEFIEKSLRFKRGTVNY